jgi:tubulin polyglutamylase TTLL6/13
MLDHNLKPWLIEVNHTPSFTTDTPFDRSIKKNVIKDALKIMNVSIEQKIKLKNRKRVELQQRVLTGKKTKLTPEEKQEAIEKAQKERDVWERENCGSYEKIYPIDVTKYLNSFLFLRIPLKLMKTMKAISKKLIIGGKNGRVQVYAFISFIMLIST